MKRLLVAAFSAASPLGWRIIHMMEAEVPPEAFISNAFLIPIFERVKAPPTHPFVPISSDQICPRRGGGCAKEAAHRAGPQRIAGSMEGHAEMSTAQSEGSWKERMASKTAGSLSVTAVMNWSMSWLDICVGLLVAGALAAWMPPNSGTASS
ncbi:MAG TPA: hypothetical protein VF573_21590 [Paraburkholderia sp.]|uniref:hypothetical protein n=1 Tax=Paraburkholderia sp. TaxID=1926495 RepID=UPI002ED0F651